MMTVMDNEFAFLHKLLKASQLQVPQYSLTLN